MISETGQGRIEHSLAFKLSSPHFVYECRALYWDVQIVDDSRQ